MIPRLDGEGGIIDDETDSGSGPFARFVSWFLEASLLVRTAVVALPVVVLAGIGGGVYWTFFSAAEHKPPTAVEAKSPAVAAKSAPEAKAGAKSAIDEELFAGIGPEGATENLPLNETPADPQADAKQEALSEEKFLAIFADSAAPEGPESHAGKPAAKGANPGGEPAPLVVSREEERLALSQARRAAPKAEPVVAPEVLETRERDVARVVAELRLAMGRDDAKSVHDLFVKLGKVKAGGEADPYVLNMRAYWEVAKGRYDRAEIYLKQVLERRKDDLEAGLNMAVVEMRTQRTAESRERLHGLSRLYPGDPRIGEMLRHLP
ncbi:MAG: tetratricopeptide repeat protein [Magnetococcales bacterium]|nr:tetratricopeptide repeat protein [Magnetococcales bacterium]